MTRVNLLSTSLADHRNISVARPHDVDTYIGQKGDREVQTMRQFIAIENIVHLKRQLEIEADPKQRAIIERLLFREEAELASYRSKLCAREPESAAKVA